jgi:translation initiation factor 2 beta subunit (eIF-2beta)/eIF-5
VAAASELTQAIKGNLKENVTKLDLKELERLAQIFEEAAKKVSEANAGRPRVPEPEENEEEENTSEGAESPRVANDTQKEPKQTATIPRVPSVNNREAERLQQPALRRSRRLNTNITVDAMLTVMELSGREISPQQLAGRRFPMQFLCEVAGGYA